MVLRKLCVAGKLLGFQPEHFDINIYSLYHHQSREIKLKDECDKETLLYSNIFKQKLLLTLNGSYSSTSLSWLFHPVKLYNKT